MATLPANLQSRRGSLLCKKKSSTSMKRPSPGVRAHLARAHSMAGLPANLHSKLPRLLCKKKRALPGACRMHGCWYNSSPQE
jgi:hypothetical protein